MNDLQVNLEKIYESEINPQDKENIYFMNHTVYGNHFKDI